jgi:hypothetical protein
MLTAQSANPHVALRPFIYWYVQRETLSKNGEVVESVFPCAGAMLEFQFAAVYEIRACGTEQLRQSWSCFSGRSGCIACLGCRSHLWREPGRKDARQIPHWDEVFLSRSPEPSICEIWLQRSSASGQNKRSNMTPGSETTRHRSMTIRF